LQKKKQENTTTGTGKPPEKNRKKTEKNLNLAREKRLPEKNKPEPNRKTKEIINTYGITNE